MTTTTTTGGQVGRSLPRLEAREKVTGRAEYTHTMRLPGMLHGKVFRSTVAHGRIKSIDVSAARKVPGVYRVVTSDDVRKVIPEPYYGPAFHDQPILAIGKVHYVGEPVAVVLAADPHVAEEAAQLIVAEYEELPAIYDEVEAAENKTLVHEELKPAGTFADLKHLKGRKGTNIALDFRLRSGDVDKAFAQAAHVFEHTFRTQKVLHLALEPYASIGDWKETGITIYSAAQGPSFVRTEIARLLGWPENRVRIKVPYLGGGFGGKLYIKLEALVTALSMIARRPVKVALTMEEQFYTITKHPSTFRIKSGVDQSGRITARKCEVYWNGGAYADIGPRVTQKSGFTASGPYDIENVWINSYALYTNLPPAGALRGFGIPQLVWAYESHTDMMARALKLDPIEFRRKNVLREGRPHATGTIVKDAKTEAALDRVAERLNWKQPLDRGTATLRRGRGVAMAMKAVISPTTSVANINISADGSTILYCGTVDMGQGSDTAMAQIIGEVLNIAGRERQGGAARHRRDALRHGHAGLALAVPHGSRGQARGRGGARQDQGAGALCGRARGQQHPAARAVPQEIRHAGRQHRGHRHLQAGLRAARFGDRAHPQRDPVLDVRRRRLRGRGRYRDRACAHHPADQCGRLRPAGEPEDRRDADFRRLADAARLHDVREDASRRRPSDQRVARRLQDSRHPRRAGDHGERAGGRAPIERSVRRQGRGRDRDLLRVAGDRQCHRGRLRRAPHRASAQRRGGVSRAARQGRQPARRRAMSTTRTISFTLNGDQVTAEIKPHHNLVEVLQRDFNLMGARESCGQGMCGCCTVLVDGTAVSGCLYLAAFIDGTEVTTVEHLADGDKLSPVQEAFIEAGAFQCGYCTPGFLLMTTQLLDTYPDPDDDQIRHYLSGNLCRCAAYPEIINAVKIAARKRKGRSAELTST